MIHIIDDTRRLEHDPVDRERTITDLDRIRPGTGLLPAIDLSDAGFAALRADLAATAEHRRHPSELQREAASAPTGPDGEHIDAPRDAGVIGCAIAARCGELVVAVADSAAAVCNDASRRSDQHDAALIALGKQADARRSAQPTAGVTVPSNAPR